jgi:chromate transporter
VGDRRSLLRRHFRPERPFPLIVLAAAVLGYIGGVLPDKFVTAGKHGSRKASYGPALIDDDTATRACPFPLELSAQAVLIGAALWMLPMGLLTVIFGWQGTPQMGWFFTKAALLTFGGAYAVLPYVYQVRSVTTAGCARR